MTARRIKRGGWARGKGDDATRTFIRRTYGRADAFLFGRRTYEPPRAIDDDRVRLIFTCCHPALRWKPAWR
jgi:predicted RNA polymerase sigma factor